MSYAIAEGVTLFVFLAGVSGLLIKPLGPERGSDLRTQMPDQPTASQSVGQGRTVITMAARADLPINRRPPHPLRGRLPSKQVRRVLGGAIWHIVMIAVC